MKPSTNPLQSEAALVAAALTLPERYEINAERLDWPLGKTSGVPGLPDGVAIMPLDRSHAAVLLMPCASGKTFTVRREAVPISKTKLVLVVTCNRLFTRATCADWEKLCGEDNVYCYLDGLGKSEKAKEAKARLPEVCDRGHGVIFISIESFLALNGIIDPPTVGMLLLEETCELASKMLSETCPDVRPFRLLRDVAQGAERILYTDADFEADGPDDGRCLRLAKYLSPRLPLRIFTLSGQADHTKRSVDIYFDHTSAASGRDFDAWWAKLRDWLKKWQPTGGVSGNRVAVALPTREMVRRVCALAMELGMWWCDYTSETSDDVKNAELGSPAEHWVEVGLVAFTQSLSVGADPQGIEFAAVFVYVQSFGCSVRCLFQGSLRFGRDARYPLKCTTIFLCIKGFPLQGDALDALRERMQGTTYHSRAFALLKETRTFRTIEERSLGPAVTSVGSQASSSTLGRKCTALDAFGGGVKSTYVEPTDEELWIAAWAWAEQQEQREDIYSVVKAALCRHGWIENGAALDVRAATAINKLPAPAAVPDVVWIHDVSVAKQVSSLKSPTEQFAWALLQIRSSFKCIDAFYVHCYQLKELSFLSAPEKVLMRAWTLLRHLPREMIDTVTSDELMELRKSRNAIELHAHGICVGSTVLRAQEALVRDQCKGGWSSLRRSRHLERANQLDIFEELAKILLVSQVHSFFVDPGSDDATIGAAKPAVIRALESSRRNAVSAEVDTLMNQLQELERRLGILGDSKELATTIRRICRVAYITMDLKTRKVRPDDEAEQDDGESGDETSNDRRRRTRVRTQQPQRKRAKVEHVIVGAVFKRTVYKVSYRDEAGKDVTEVRDYAIDWKVESPHSHGLLACAREWFSAHSDEAIPVPSDLRRAVEEDLGIYEPEPPPPGQGAYEERPAGNAKESGTLCMTKETAESSRLIFKPPPKPRIPKEGYLQKEELIPWERLGELMKLVAAQLALTLDKDMRTMLSRGSKTLARLKRDVESLDIDENGMKWKPTYYARRMPLGRLTAGGSSMQPMPNELRQWLYRGLLHDLDFENAHPTIILGLVKHHRPSSWESAVPYFVRYVAHRHAFLDAIVKYYGLPNRDFAKTAILVAINGGELRFWRTKVKSPVSPLKPDMPDLLALKVEAVWIRNIIVFGESAFATSIPALMNKLRDRISSAGRTEEELKRSAFSYVLGHIESMALEAACAVLERCGFVPTSRIYDGCLVTHNSSGDLNMAIRKADEAVAAAVGFTGLKLKEKDMFALREFSLSHSSREATRQAVLDAIMQNDEEYA